MARTAEHPAPDHALDHATATRLSHRFNDCFRTFDAGHGLFTDDAFFDLLPPFWRFQLEGPEVFARQLAAIAPADVSITVLRTVPTATGFVTEHLEEGEEDGQRMQARRMWLCEVRDGRISEVTGYCNGGWNDELRARHAAEAPMIRP
jgi:hypothetical protein